MRINITIIVILSLFLAIIALLLIRKYTKYLNQRHYEEICNRLEYVKNYCRNKESYSLKESYNNGIRSSNIFNSKFKRPLNIKAKGHKYDLYVNKEDKNYYKMLKNYISVKMMAEYEEFKNCTIYAAVDTVTDNKITIIDNTAVQELEVDHNYYGLAGIMAYINLSKFKDGTYKINYIMKEGYRK